LIWWNQQVVQHHNFQKWLVRHHSLEVM
jgi:hypothetical protein